MPLFDRNNRSHLFDPGGDQEIAVNDEQGQALARGSQIGDANLTARIRHAFSPGARNKGHGTTMSVDNAEAVNLPISTAFLNTGPSDVPYGARGRDPGGWPKVIPIGVPPAVSGEPRRMQVPKELRIPTLPFNYYQRVAVPVLANTGDVIDEECAFPIGTLYIDNYSSSWLYADGAAHWIPPLTMGWVLPCYRKPTKMHLSAQAPGPYTQPTFVAGGTCTVIGIETVASFSPGFSIAGSVGTSGGTSATVLTDPLIDGQFADSQIVSFMPASATPQEVSTATATGAIITATLTATAATRAFITGFDVTLGVAGLLATVTVTVTGLTNQLNFVIVGTTGQTDELSIRFPVPIPASALNTSIVVTLPAIGGGAAVNAVCAYGFNN